VELHAAHGYLLHQSFLPWANRRSDQWGEPLRFVEEVAARVRGAIGPERALSLRISLDDWVRPEAGGLGADGTREVARALTAGGRFDLLNTSGGSRAGHYARAIGSYHHPPGELLPLVARLKAAVGDVPVVGVGRIATPALAERALADGTCDLVAMTRAQIADPDVVRKLQAGRAGRIRPCVAANQGCVDRMVAGLPITCFHNPDVGREHRLAPTATPPPPVSGWREPDAGREDGPGAVGEAVDRRSVLVVGGGPAGLKAAEIAARRGHRVTLRERADELGGRLRLVARCGPPRELLRAVAWVAAELAGLDAEVRMGTEVDAGLVAAARPAVVVLATGAPPERDPLPPGDGSVPVLSLDAAVTAEVAGQRVLVVDRLGTIDVAMTAERLAAAGAAVTVVTPLPGVGANIGFTQIGEQLGRLYGLGCALEPSTAFAGIEGGHVATRHLHARSRAARPFDAVVAGVPGRPDLTLREAALATGARVLVAGDAVAPRSAMHAFREGDDAGRAA
jgi:NADPH-dependent 2,4-dienoyl-CoA reductase/sulfur reductase-like enzyme